MSADNGNQKSWTDFGFSFDRGGVHTARTMMLDELEMLLSYVDSTEASKADYLRAVEEDNCLSKRSGKTRRLTYRHLSQLYSLDTTHILFRGLCYFWSRDESARPILAALCAYARDSIFRSTAPLVLEYPSGAVLSRDALEQFIDRQEPNRFSSATLKSTAQNINSSWTKSGHLSGRARKIRTHPTPSVGNVSYALLLGYLRGARGSELFGTEYMRLVDCPRAKAIELAEEASRKGWIRLKRVGDVIEVLFPGLINEKEQELLREQS